MYFPSMTHSHLARIYTLPKTNRQFDPIQSNPINVQHLWKVLSDKGYIYKGTYSGWYSVRDECFYNESELIDGKAPTGAEVEWVAKEESYFFKLSEFEQPLLEMYEQYPDMIAPKSRKNEVVSFVKGGLRDLSVSRTSFKWGVPVPGDEEHVMYVWIDALANYMSALGYPDESPDGKYAKFWPASVHIVGKDILRFHAVYWPAFLMAAGIPVPKRVFAHGWWTKDGEKISKSLGNVIDPIDLVNTYGVDATRFFLMSDVPFGNDGDYSDTSMIYKCNANLANELGNLAHRVCTLVYKNCNASIPTPGVLTAEDEDMLANARGVRGTASGHIANQAIHQYSNTMISLVKDANKYIDVMSPWALKKTDPERMDTVLYVLMETLRYVGILYQPLIPDSANKILDQLTVPQDERTFAHLDSSPLKSGTPMDEPKIVLYRFEIPGEAEKTVTENKQAAKKKQGNTVPIDIDITRLDIRVGVITKAWEHEDADTLFCEEIDIGEESGPRQIASGLRGHYKVEDLEGQRVLVLTNLKSRTLMGFPSHGMVLCASSGERTEFVVPPADAVVGERIFVDGFDGEAASENQIGKKKMLEKIFPELKTNEDGVAMFRGIPLMTSAGECKAQNGLSGADVA
jgi:methionyl-tRNA synthetase